MVTPYNSLSVLQQIKNLSTVNLGVNVNSFPINSNIRYSFDTLGLTNTSMGNLQGSQGSFNYSGISNILNYARDNQMKVRIGLLVNVNSFPSWFTRMTDRNIVLTTLNTHIRTVVTYLNTNYTNIIEYDLINDVFNNSGYKSIFPNTILGGGSNVVSTVFATAHSVLGASSKIKLLYNHSNAEDAYTSNTVISILSNFRTTYGYPIDGISLNLNANSNVSFLKIENSIINIIGIGYSNITLNSVNFSIPDTTTTNLNEQARFYKALIEIKLNYNVLKTITLAGFNDSDVTGRNNSVLFSNNTPKLAYSNIIDLYNTYDWNWLNVTYFRTLNRNEMKNPDRFIIIDNPVLLNYTQPTITPTSLRDVTNQLLASSNISIPNDFLGLSQTPFIIDPYLFKYRHSYSNLINLFKLTKKSNLGMRFRSFIGLTHDKTFKAEYNNKKLIERLNYSKSIGPKCALQLGTGNIIRSLNVPENHVGLVPASYYQPPNLSDSVYDRNISNFVQSVDDIVSDLDPSIFETIEIFNEPDVLRPQIGYVSNIHGVNYYKKVYKSIITELNKNSNIGDKINLGSYATPNYYKNPAANPIIDLDWLEGKVNSVSFHSYPAGMDENLDYSKLCRPIVDGRQCVVLDVKGNSVPSSSGNPMIKNYLDTPPHYLPTISNHKFRAHSIPLSNLLSNLMYSSDNKASLWKPMVTDINEKIVKPATSRSTYSYGFHLNETNTIAAHGLYGISDIFGSALWVIDWSFYNALINIRRINLHALEDTPMPYNMIDYPDKFDLDVPFDSIINVRPIFYGYWFTHAAMRCGAGNTPTKIMDHYEDATKSLRIWKLNNGSETTYVVIYYNNTDTINCRIRAVNQSMPTTRKVIRLLSRDGIYGTSGITFGNLCLDGTKNGIPYNVKNSRVTPITLTEAGIDSALESVNYDSIRDRGIYFFTIPIKSPSAFILRA
jgi:GH35 family endo-1,4-beta-xylanase